MLELSEEIEPLREKGRKKISELVKDIIDNNFPERKSVIEAIAINFEKSVINFITQPHFSDQCTNQRYTRRLMTILQLLKDHKSTDGLAFKIINKEIRFKTLEKMTGYEIFYKKWLTYKDNRHFGEKKEVPDNQMFKCSRCKSRKIIVSQYQSRGADESMTTHLTCNNCGKNWRFS